MKKKLIEFINYFHLGGTNEKVIITTLDGKTKCRCINDDRTVITDVQTNALFDDKETFGIYELSQFKKFLSVVDEKDTSYILKKNGDINTQIQIKNAKISVKYNLADSTIIPAAPDKLKKEPTWNYEIQITPEIVKYIVTALDVTKSQLIQFLFEDDKLVCNIGNLQFKENTVQIQLDYKELQKPVSQVINFNSNYFSNILQATEKGTLNLSFDGLYLYKYEDETTECNYIQKSIIINN